jgi:DNA-binding GntR family transcriptional regulator
VGRSRMTTQVSTTTRRRTAKLTPRPVPRATLPDEVYRRIKDLILDGNLAPGELVTIQGLAEAFEVSAMPVREALTRLTAEKALTVIAGRSVGIPNLDAARLRDMTRVRLPIETTAARWAAESMTQESLARIESLYEEMSRAAAERDRHTYIRANRDFHFEIYRSAGSDTLLGIVEGLWLQVSPYFHVLHWSHNYVISNEQHRLILLALKARDGDAAAAALHRDISAAAEMLTQLLT